MTAEPVPAPAYPPQSSYAFAPGVTCVTTPAGAVLLNPPRTEKLSGLPTEQLAVLKTLNLGPATLAQLSSSADPATVGALIDRLLADGWLAVDVCDHDGERYRVEPFDRPVSSVAPRQPGQWVLSRFAVVHRDRDGFVVEHPLGWCDVRIGDARLLPLLDGEAAAEVPEALAARFVADLSRGGFLVAAGETEPDLATAGWSTPDLWFHRRSTLGSRTVSWERFGPTKWAKDRFPQPPARRETYPGDPVRLTTPDLATARAADPPLTAVLEDRVSTREFDDAAPITADQLAELLYRAARTRGSHTVGPGEELLSRPYPSAGGVYELEVYPVVRHVAGLAAGMYHYDSFDHVLRPVADGESKAVQQLLKPASATLAGGAQPQVLLVVAARAGRLLWTYEQIGYALLLKDVGVLMQTLYLVGTAMGIGVCAQGYADTASFAAATGSAELAESAVGSVVVGSAR